MLSNIIGSGMKISIIIPTYKPQDYIWECLDSIRNQTFSKENFEVILVLNGCKEPYYSQIQEYIDKNFVGYNVNFIQTDQGGVSNARNIALDVAKGEYITFIDDDDYISPKYLEELYQAAAPKIVSLSNAVAFIDGDIKNNFSFALSREFEQKSSREIQPLLIGRRYFAGPWMKLIHNSIIRDKKFDIRFKNGEDSIYMFLISDKIESVRFTSSNAIYYRRYRENSAVTQKRTIAQRFINAMKMIWEYIKIYAKSPHTYNFGFFFTRILGTLKSIFFTA